MKDLLQLARVVVRTSTTKISRRLLADYGKNFTKRRVARAARLFFIIHPIKTLVYSVEVSVSVAVVSREL